MLLDLCTKNLTVTNINITFIASERNMLNVSLCIYPAREVLLLITVQYFYCMCSNLLWTDMQTFIQRKMNVQTDKSDVMFVLLSDCQYSMLSHYAAYNAARTA